MLGVPSLMDSDKMSPSTVNNGEKEDNIELSDIDKESLKGSRDELPSLKEVVKKKMGKE